MSGLDWMASSPDRLWPKAQYVVQCCGLALTCVPFSSVLLESEAWWAGLELHVIAACLGLPLRRARVCALTLLLIQGSDLLPWSGCCWRAHWAPQCPGCCWLRPGTHNPSRAWGPAPGRSRRCPRCWRDRSIQVFACIINSFLLIAEWNPMLWMHHCLFNH